MGKRTKKAGADPEAKAAANTVGTANLAPFRWKPGQSGNPSGRPAVIAELRDLARAHTGEALETLCEVMRDKGAPPAARVAAVSHILDRGYGKPTQHVSATVQNIRQMTDDELLSYISGPDEADSGEGAATASSDQGKPH